MSDPLINYEAEAELLGSMMLANAAIDRVADLITEADFAEPVHGRIYSALLREAMGGKTANAMTIRGYFEGDESLNPLGGVVYLARLQGSATGLAPYEVAGQVADLAKRRRMRAGLSVAAQACADLESTLSEIVTHADAAMNVTGGNGISVLTAGECIDALLRSFDAGEKGVQCQVIEPLDSLLGPMKPKQLIIGAGRPGMGKTAVALSYALGAAEAGHGVLFVSLEMSGPELGARMLSDLCFGNNEPVPYNFIRDGDLYGRQADAVIRAKAKAHHLPLQIVDTGSLTMGRLSMLVRQYQRRFAADGFSLDLVVVDYLQLLHPDSKSRSAYEAVSEVSRGLKALAKDNSVAVFALAQLSRSVESRDDKSPQLSDLRDSGQIEQDADAVLFFLRQEYYLSKEADENRDADWQALMEDEQGKIDFILAKRRNGVTGRAKGQFLGQYQAVRG